jgi:hypothetical protein
MQLPEGFVARLAIDTDGWQRDEVHELSKDGSRHVHVGLEERGIGSAQAINGLGGRELGS